MKRFLYGIAVIFVIIGLLGCESKTQDEGAGSIVSKEEMPKDLTDEDKETVDELNSESSLFCNIYEDIGIETEYYQILAGEKSSAVAVRIPRNDGKTRIKEIEIKDAGYDIYGLGIGVFLGEFEKKMNEKGFISEASIESEAFRKGNVYISVSCDKNDKIQRIFINLLVDYQEWRGIE